MKNLKRLTGILLILLFALSCKKEKPDPPIVVTAAMKDISYTTATAGGNVTSEGGAPVISRGVCWNTSASPVIDNSKSIVSGTTGEFTTNLTQLTPNTLYYIRAYATNSGGTSYGSEITFTTNKIEVPVLTTETVTSITQTTAISGGNITDEKGSQVTARGVCWNTSENPTVQNSKTTDGTGPGTFISNITGLTGNTTYYLRAYATNIAGTQYGSQITFKTSPVLPSLSTMAVSSISYRSANVGGEVTNTGGADVTERGICWGTEEGPTTLNNKISIGNGTGQFSSTLNTLEPDTKYYLRAYATNSVGTQYGSQVIFTTLRITPPTLTTTEISEILFIAAKSGGNITAENGAGVIARGVCWSTSQNPTVNDSKTLDGLGSGAFNSSLASLLPGTKYYVRAYATNSSGTGYGNQIEFSTISNTANDIEGNNYNVIQIGEQFWFKDNLRTTKFSNGDPIPTTTPYTVDISGETEPKYQWPAAGDETKVGVYGRLYTWYAVNDNRNICPDKWHVATLQDYEALINYLGGENVAGDKLKESGTTHWPSPNTATNESEFTGLPGGDKSESMFRAFGDFGFYWTSSFYGVSGGNSAYYLQLDYGLSSALMKSHYRHYGYSVRCISNRK